ncbi:17345_t:CDS:2, partial [Cetraspora pellucida]
MNSTKTFHFGNNSHGNEYRAVVIKELLHSSYGCYIWPSAFVLAEYIWDRRNLFKDKTILELGAGTSLPGFLCASLSPQTHVILTDQSDYPQILENIYDGARLNRLLLTSDDIFAGSLRPNIWIRGLNWGEFCLGNQGKDKSEEGNLLQLLRDIEQNNRKLDWILGSDTFYDPKDFADIIATIAYILNYHAPKAKFLTSYQERSSKRTIQYLLDKWKLKCRQISLKSFNFDYDKYTSNNNSELSNSINNTSEATCRKEMIYSSSLQ